MLFELIPDTKKHQAIVDICGHGWYCKFDIGVLRSLSDHPMWMSIFAQRVLFSFVQPLVIPCSTHTLFHHWTTSKTMLDK